MWVLLFVDITNSAYAIYTGAHSVVATTAKLYQLEHLHRQCRAECAVLTAPNTTNPTSEGKTPQATCTCHMYLTRRIPEPLCVCLQPFSRRRAGVPETQRMIEDSSLRVSNALVWFVCLPPQKDEVCVLIFSTCNPMVSQAYLELLFIGTPQVTSTH